MTVTAALHFQYSSRNVSPAAMCRRASIRFGFRCEAESSTLSPHVCLYFTDSGGNRILFNFTNNAPGRYAIKGIHYHDAGLLGAAVELRHTAGPDAEVRNQNFPLSRCLDQSVPGDLLSGAAFYAGVPDQGRTRLFALDDSQSESVVNIFDLDSGVSFTDTLYALTEGSLCIALQIMDLVAHSNRCYINDSLPMIAQR